MADGCVCKVEDRGFTGERDEWIYRLDPLSFSSLLFLYLALKRLEFVCRLLSFVSGWRIVLRGNYNGCSMDLKLDFSALWCFVCEKSSCQIRVGSEDRTENTNRVNPANITVMMRR